MRYIPGRIGLDEILVGLLGCYDGDQVAFLDTEGSELLGFAVETGLDAVYIYSTGFVNEVEVTIGLEVELLGYALLGLAFAVGNHTADTVEYVSCIFGCEELLNGNGLYMIVVVNITQDLRIAVVRSL